jgi:RNA polymerase sigma factor (sigma-70 family)
MKACANISQFDGRSSLRTWCHKIAYHEYVRWRRNQRFCLRIPRSRPAEDSAFDQCLDAAVLTAALSKLSAIHRETFLLSEVQQLSLEEVGQVTNASVGTVNHACTMLGSASVNY